MTQLRRFVEPPNPRRLGEVLKNPRLVATEPIGADVNLDDFDRVADETLAGPERSKADAVMAEALHRALAGSISRRDAADMRLWHWLCVSHRPNLVWRRWSGHVPEDPEEALTPSMRERFLGAATLNGVSRNTFARLWWCAETLQSDEEGYRLTAAVLQKQDLFQAVFERRFGLHGPTAAAFITRFAAEGESQWREAAKRLDYRLGTVVLESLADEDVVRLIDSCGG